MTISFETRDVKLASNTSNHQFPSEDICILHLKFLDAVYHLKQDISRRDGLFGLHESIVPGHLRGEERLSSIEKIREKRWAIYVTKAVKRFEAWFTSLRTQMQSEMFDLNRMYEIGYVNITEAQPLEFNVDTLPPLDVLMVWHSFMLNPRMYLSDCIRLGAMSLWATGLPWSAIALMLERGNEPSDVARTTWSQLTDLPWDVDDRDSLILSCPWCRVPIAVPWTTVLAIELCTVTDPLGLGYADGGFKTVCRCGTRIDHNRLRLFKFKTDLDNLVQCRVPMPGTLLNFDGQPIHSSKSELGRRSTEGMTFPNQFLRDSEVVGKFYWANIDKPQDIRNVLHYAIHGPTGWLWYLVGTKPAPKLTRLQEISIRRMMSVYWTTSDIFSMDLVGAVVRQGVFIQKMQKIGWVGGILKYGRFFEIMAKYDRMTVPTLDVDLVWHTHQLSPQGYYRYSNFVTGRFVDHDDKIADTVLSNSFEWTSKVYAKEFGCVYSDCGCWYCEGLREPNGLKRMLQQRQKVEGEACISAHNAFRAKGRKEFAEAEMALEKKLHARFEKALSRAKKAGKPLPVKDKPYGISHSAVFVSTPGCGSLSGGSAGNCIRGTCMGGVAMGSCLGSTESYSKDHWSKHNAGKRGSEGGGGGGGSGGDSGGDGGGCGGCGGG